MTDAEFRALVRDLRAGQLALPGYVRELTVHRRGPKHAELKIAHRAQQAECARLAALVDNALKEPTR